MSKKRYQKEGDTSMTETSLLNQSTDGSDIKIEESKDPIRTEDPTVKSKTFNIDILSKDYMTNLNKSIEDQLNAKLKEQEEAYKRTESFLEENKYKAPVELLGDLIAGDFGLTSQLAKSLVELNHDYLNYQTEAFSTGNDYNLSEKIAKLNQDLWKIMLEVFTAKTDLEFNVGMAVIDMAYRAYSNDKNTLYYKYNVGVEYWSDTKSLGTFMLISTYIATRYFEEPIISKKMSLIDSLSNLKLEIGDNYAKRISNFYS